MSTLLQDLRYAARVLRHSPGFTLAAVLSMALGLGANTAIFSVANALLLKPLPYADADRLTILWNRSPGLGIAEDWFSTAQYFDITTSHSGFEQVAIAIGGNYNLTGTGEPERVGTIRVSSNLLPMLGVRPALGRLFVAQEDAAGAPGTAVLGHGTWIRRFGGNPSAIGTSLILNGEPYQIVGVLPESFDLPREVLPTLGGAEHAEIVLPLPLKPDAPTIRTAEDYNILGKLKPGMSVQVAQAEMEGITARLRRDFPADYPANGGLTFSIVPLQEQVVGDVRRSLLVLMAAVGFVLLIACANVANLLLARAVGRQREVAVRASLGAGRGRLIRQLLTESVLLGLAGGALGLVLAYASLQGIQVLGTRSVPRLAEIGLDLDVLLFTFVVSITSAIAFGLAPALRLSRAALHEYLKDAGRGSSGASALWARGHNMRRLLVVSELALSVVLLVGAGLLIRSFARLQNVPPGFNPSSVLTLELTMSGRKYTDGAAAVETYRRLWERLRGVPGVEGAGSVSALPLSQMFAWGPITVEGRPLPAGEKFINTDIRIVSGDYFQTMQIPLVRGRLLNEFDTRTSQRVVVVDEHMAAQLWPGEDAVGKRLKLGGVDSENPWLTVVGIVGRVKQYTLDGDSRIATYFPHTQYPVRAMNVVVRGREDPSTMTSAVRAEIRALDPDLPIYGVRTMGQRVDESLASRRFSTLLLALLAALALGLATIGVYGVMAYLVNQGVRELGIRMALGATPGAILRLIVGQGMLVALLGVAIGIAGALAITRFMGSLLFGIEAHDPLTFSGMAILLALIATVASYIPARRAARIDPMVSLRSE
jgi:predicted permease